jgi:signal transduction histidine kinase
VTFRRKLLIILALTVFSAVAAVSVTVLYLARRTFEREENARTDALVAQFRRDFDRRGRDIVAHVQAVCGTDAARRIALDLGNPTFNPGAYIPTAEPIASSQQLEFLEFVAADGSIISSAQAPAQFGYKDAWANDLVRLAASGPVLRREELSDGPTLGLFAVRAVDGGAGALYVIGGRRLDREFLASLSPSEGMHVVLYRKLGGAASTDDFVQSDGEQLDFQRLLPLVREAQGKADEVSGTVAWSPDPGDVENFRAIPLKGAAGEALGVLLVGSSRAELVRLERHIGSVALLIGGAGILIVVLLSGWVAARMTRPVEQLASGAREVAGGNWRATVDVKSHDEIGELAAAFNRMTTELVTQRDHIVQAERVAAWRELARRLAHELKNPLFPLQITVENLVRAREAAPQEFDEIFRESTQTLLAELANLKSIIGRFSDFSKMPQPQLTSVQVNDVIEQVAKLFEPQLRARSSPVMIKLEVDRNLPRIQVDPDLLHRALSNLVLNALDALPNGGTITLRTARDIEGIRIEVADTGAGLAPEECERLFTPYYTTKQHGTGLGLAIVQSVVTDHRGRITVESAPGRGATFRIQLPLRLAEGLPESQQAETAGATRN